MKHSHIQYTKVLHKVLCLFCCQFCILCCNKLLCKFQGESATNHWLEELEKNGKLLAWRAIKDLETQRTFALRMQSHVAQKFSYYNR